jgi:hypothetical protein
MRSGPGCPEPAAAGEAAAQVATVRRHVDATWLACGAVLRHGQMTGFGRRREYAARRAALPIWNPRRAAARAGEFARVVMPMLRHQAR